MAIPQSRKAPRLEQPIRIPSPPPQDRLELVVNAPGQELVLRILQAEAADNTRSPALPGPQHASQGGAEGALAGAVRAEDRHPFATMEGKGNAAQDDRGKGRSAVDIAQLGN